MKKLSKIEGACALRALRYAAGAPEDPVVEACLMQGSYDSQWKPAANKLGLRLKKTLFRRIMLKKFLKKYPSGLFLMASHNHLFVVDGGRVIDQTWNNAGLSRMIIQAWRVI